MATIGIYSAFGPFWALPPSILADDARAAAIATINSIGNLGGFVGPFAVGYLKRSTGSFLPGMVVLVASPAAAGLLVHALGPRPTAPATAAAGD